MPKMTFRGIRNFSIATLLLSGMAACAWQGLTPDASGPRKLYISGHSAHLTDAQVATLAAPYLRASAPNVDLPALRKTLAAQPWLTDVQVSKRWPDGIVIHIADHKAVADWGTDQLLAADGDLFTPEKRPDGLVQLDGPAGQASKVYAQYQQLSGILAGHGVHLASLTLSRDGDWQGRLDDGLVLRLGQAQLAERMQRFVNYALTQSAAKQALAKAGYVDLRYSDGFAVGGTRKPSDSAGGQEKIG